MQHSRFAMNIKVLLIKEHHHDIVTEDVIIIEKMKFADLLFDRDGIPEMNGELAYVYEGVLVRE